MNNKTVLITGIAGLLGSRLADWILENEPGTKIIGIDDLSGGYFSNINPGVKAFHQIDVAEELARLDTIFDVHKPDIVYHFAAYAAEALSPFIRGFNYTNNLVATANVVTCCIKYDVKRLVFTSSMAVYGHATPPFVETLPRTPIDPYGVAKAACEQDIEIAGEQHGLDWCIIRPHNVYGAKQNIWDSYRNVLGIWMYKALHGQDMTVYGDGSQVRAFSYIDDSLPCLWRAGTEPQCSKQIINLGGIENISILDAATTLQDVLKADGLSVGIEMLPPRHEVHIAHSTWHRSVEMLGFEYKTSLYDGLTKMWEWVKLQDDRPRMIWSEYELDKGIYPYWNKDTLLQNSKTTTLL